MACVSVSVVCGAFLQMLASGVVSACKASIQLSVWPLQGATFACVNAVVPGDEAGAAKEDDAAAATVTGGDAASQLSTFALRIKLPEVLDQFVAAVNAHKAGGKRQAAADP